MRLDGTILRLSATDLARQVACAHLVELERAVAEGRLEREFHDDPALARLLQRGLEFEAHYLDGLRARGLEVIELRDVQEVTTARERTESAMRRGAGAIAQAALQHGRWYGRADLLLRIDSPSELGSWSYEVADTKLARTTRGGTVLQLCLYSDLVGRIQGTTPERMHVVKPGEDGEPLAEPFRFDDFGAYYRLVRRRLEQTADAAPRDDTYPHPVPHCDVCAWWPRCDRRRRDDDHLSLVAGLQSLHRVELESRGVRTLQAFAELAEPIDDRPERGSRETYERLQGQARVQLQGRRERRPVHELLPVEQGTGLTRLPEPAPNDVFFDLEADPFVDGGGLEYLFGWAWRDEGKLVYRDNWACDRKAERRAFEAFLDFVMDRWREDPGMHVYHFGVYEPGAIKRLMGRHGTREAEVDRLLRAGRFVDLHAVTRQGVRASVERYSLKDLEALTGFERAVELRRASEAMHRVDAALELDLSITPADRETVEGYNRDDCLATAALRDWLEQRRAELIVGGVEIVRPSADDGAASEAVEEMEARVREVYDRLTADLPDGRDRWSEEHHARWLLAHTLEYFRREDRCAWWEFFRLRDLDHEELLRERKAVAGLSPVGEVEGGTRSCPVHRYRFPPQEAALDEGDLVHRARAGAAGTTADAERTEVGTVVAIDQARRTIDLKKRKTARDFHPAAIVVQQRVPPKPLDASLLELARSVAEHGVDGAGPFRAARDVLLKRPPRRSRGMGGPLGEDSPALRRAGESAVEAALRLVGELDHGALAIQGPPGSGKTFTGARMIVELARAGSRIGVTAVSHKVIRNLLDEALVAAREAGVELQAAHKPSSRAKPSTDLPDGLEEIRDNDAALAVTACGTVVGGTAWLWAREEAMGSLDVLFVDEAGQMSLAQLLAVGRSARNLVLLGDPQQLEQPQQGTHPEGSGRSALEHILDGRRTIPDHVGLFLDRTWRLHPELCAFTSEVYYERRLESREGLEGQAIHGAPPFDGSGLYWVPVPHTANQNSSEEEVDAVVTIVRRLTREGAVWTDRHGVRRPMTPADVLVVAPYNAQVGALSRRLPNARVGTVDKFQGQQAPVVVYSMASSSVDDAPRGMGFLFNPNRFNVATSRARCACILVASPALLDPDCRSPEQMRWANGICRFVEGVKSSSYVSAAGT